MLAGSSNRGRLPGRAGPRVRFSSKLRAALEPRYRSLNASARGRTLCLAGWHGDEAAWHGDEAVTSLIGAPATAAGTKQFVLAGAADGAGSTARAGPAALADLVSAGERFDTISSTLWLPFAADAAGFIDDLDRLLDEGGRLLCLEPVPRRPRQGRFRRSPDPLWPGFDTMLRAAGFAVTDIERFEVHRGGRGGICSQPFVALRARRETPLAKHPVASPKRIGAQR